MLKKIDLETALDMVNKKHNFTRIAIDDFDGEKDRYLSFEVISEYDWNEGCINWSEREGDITDKIKKMNLFDVFYDEDFVSDGLFVPINTFSSIEELLREEDDFHNTWLLARNKFYITNGNMEEISELPHGLYTMIQYKEDI